MSRTAQRFVVCLKNTGYEVSLEPRKIYLSIADAQSEKLGLLRVVDESGDDYLFPKAHFTPIDLPQPVRRMVLQAA